MEPEPTNSVLQERFRALEQRMHQTTVEPLADITLREYLELKMDNQHRLLVAVLDEKDTANKLQNTETLRRLDELNHAHAEARTKEATFISRAQFDTFKDAMQQQFESFRTSISQTLAAKEGSDRERWDNVNQQLAANSGKAAGYTSAAALAMALAGLLLNFLHR